jgi:hypothetical protein
MSSGTSRPDPRTARESAIAAPMTHETLGPSLDFGARKSEPRVAGVGTPPPEERALDPETCDLQNRKQHPDTLRPLEPGHDARYTRSWRRMFSRLPDRSTICLNGSVYSGLEWN